MVERKDPSEVESQDAKDILNTREGAEKALIGEIDTAPLLMALQETEVWEAVMKLPDLEGLTLEQIFSDPEKLEIMFNRLEGDHSNVDPRYLGALVLVAAKKTPEFVFNFFSTRPYAELKDPNSRGQVLKMLKEAGYDAKMELFDPPSSDYEAPKKPASHVEKAPDEWVDDLDMPDGEKVTYHLMTHFGVESIDEIASDEMMTMAFLNAFNFSEEESPEESFISHFSDDEIRFFLAKIAGGQPEAFLEVINDPDFSKINPEIIQEAILIAEEAIK